MVLKDLTYFKEKENLDGKKDVILIIDCNNCPKKKRISLHLIIAYSVS